MAAERMVGFVTVRASSTRLPAKCLLQLGEMNVLTHVIRRARMYDIEPIVCTSVDRTDDVIEQVAATEGARCFRGSLINKLKRWADCAVSFKLDRFHTVDADDPFFDGEEMQRSMSLLIAERLDVVHPTVSSSAGGASVGYSLTTDIVRRASAGLPDEADTEMMWHHLDKLKGLRSAVLPEPRAGAPRIRLTLDYQEDYWLLESVRRMVGNFAPRSEIDGLFVRNPDLYKINWFRNDEWKAAQAAKTT